MKIIISPAKQMNSEIDFIDSIGAPVFEQEALAITTYLNERTFEELKSIWKCNDQITSQNQERLVTALSRKNTVPALLAYVGLQYQYMAPHVFDESQWEYVNKHLIILSGLYGILQPLDAVSPYRIEMQAKLTPEFSNNKTLYSYWGEKIYQEITRESNVILNLASKEYSKVVERYLTEDDQFVTCIFAHLIDGKLKVKATEAKMARGEMVRYLASEQITEIEGVKTFAGLGYGYSEEHSDDRTYVFLKR